MCRCLSDKDPRRCADPAHRAPYQKALRGRHRAEDAALEHVSPPEPEPAAVTGDSVNLAELISDLRRVLAVEGEMTDAEQIEAAEAEWAAEERLLGAYNGMDVAVIAVGDRIAARAEELAGITEQEIRDRYQARIAKAEASVEASKPAGPIFVAIAEGALSKIRHGDAETAADLRRLSDGWQAAVAEHRALGGTLTFHEGSSAKAKKCFQEIAELFPSDWLAASNAHRALQATVTTERAHYLDEHISKVAKQEKETDMLTPEREARIDEPDPAGQWVKTDREWSYSRTNPVTGETEKGRAPVYERLQFDVLAPDAEFKAKKDGTPFGAGWEKWVHPENGDAYWRRPVMRKGYGENSVVSQILTSDRRPMIKGRSGTFSASAHEFSHRAEASVRTIKGLEEEFLRRRTSIPDPANPSGPMLREKLVPLLAGSSEMVRPDHFAEAYIGKHYQDGCTEVLSVGMESLFGGSFGGLIGVNSHQADPEMRSFILGTLVTAGAPSNG